MLQQPISRRKRLVLQALSIFLLLLGYTLLSESKHRDNPEDRTIPTWSGLAEGLKQILEKPEPQNDLLAAALGEDVKAEERAPMLWRDLKATGIRFVAGYGVSVAGGLLLGVLMGSFLSLESLAVLPLRLASRIIPTAALAVFFVLAGTNLTMYIAMIVFGTLPAIAIGVSQEIASFPKELRYKAYSLGASHLEVIVDAFLPVKAPRIMEIIKSNIGPALVYLLAAELLVANVGFGYTIRLFSRKLDMTVVYPYLLILAFLAFALDAGIKILQTQISPWSKK
ncbi:MAG: ABC transporter permease subunit [Verrucomicrobiota bacterium]